MSGLYRRASFQKDPELYEQFLVPILFSGWAKSLLNLAPRLSDKRVLDVACGTGIVARLAAPAVGTRGLVTGIDMDLPMLVVAHDASLNDVPEINWQQGDAHKLPFPDESFDAVFCQQGLQFFDDSAAALSEMHRVLQPHGRLVVSVWRGVQPSAWAAALVTALERYGGPEVIEDLHMPCPFGEPEELYDLVTDSGFQDVQTTISVEHLCSRSAEELYRQIVSLTTLGVPLAKLDPPARAALIAGLDDALDPYKRDGYFAIPIEANVAIAVC
jgi:SAM-dependent methyltransferase